MDVNLHPAGSIDRRQELSEKRALDVFRRVPRVRDLCSVWPCCALRRWAVITFLDVGVSEFVLLPMYADYKVIRKNILSHGMMKEIGALSSSKP